MKNRKINNKTNLGIQIVTIILAAFIMACNIKILVRSGGLYPGGATGLSILIQRIFNLYFSIELPYSIVNLTLNLIPMTIAFIFIGKRFAVVTGLMIVLTSVFTDMIPAHELTSDLLLISIFGGIVNGFVISMCLRVDATTGGTDILSIFRSQRCGKDSWNLILALNIGILLIAGILFGLDKAMYSIIFQYISTQVVHMMYKKYQKETLWIVTNRPSDVCQAINAICNHGATILEGEGSYEHCDRNVVYSVVSGAEASQVVHAVKSVDQKAFINRMKTEELVGRFQIS